MMRVLHTLDGFLYVTENWIYPQITQVPGVEGRVICGITYDLEEFPIDRQNLIVHPPPWKSAFGVPRLLNAIERRIGCDGVILAWKTSKWRPLLLHAHFGTRGWWGLPLKKRLNVPLITSFYGFDAWLLPEREPVWQQRYKELFAASDLFLVEGPAMRERLVKLGCSANKVCIHRIGVDLTRLTFKARNFSGGLKIIMAGRFIEKKGLLDGLQACARARSRGVNLSVTIIGEPISNDAPGERIKEELRAMANRPELAGHVRLTGLLSHEQTRALLASHDVLLCPSKRAANGDAEGGSPVVLTEAMALGLLCIGTNHCDIPEIIIDGKTGYLCNEGDIAAIADMLCTLDNDADKLTKLTAAGRKHVEENFSLPTQLKKVHSIYSSLLNGANGYHNNQA
jgi:colanic acid/amylovoran biosynthesis glycosyltransferase